MLFRSGVRGVGHVRVWGNRGVTGWGKGRDSGCRERGGSGCGLKVGSGVRKLPWDRVRAKKNGSGGQSVDQQRGLEVGGRAVSGCMPTSGERVGFLGCEPTVVRVWGNNQVRV